MKHTKGPWEVCEDDTIRSMDFKGSTQMGDYKGVIICSVAEGHGQRNHAKKEAEANAHLIASAPTMYEALKNISKHKSNCLFCQYKIDTAKQAIAKAEVENGK